MCGNVSSVMPYRLSYLRTCERCVIKARKEKCDFIDVEQTKIWCMFLHLPIVKIQNQEFMELILYHKC